MESVKCSNWAVKCEGLTRTCRTLKVHTEGLVSLWTSLQTRLKIKRLSGEPLWNKTDCRDGPGPRHWPAGTEAQVNKLERCFVLDTCLRSHDAAVVSHVSHSFMLKTVEINAGGSVEHVMVFSF